MGITTSALSDEAEYLHTPWASNSNARYILLGMVSKF